MKFRLTPAPLGVLFCAQAKAGEGQEIPENKEVLFSGDQIGAFPLMQIRAARRDVMHFLS